MFWKHKCFGNISQLETLIGWPAGSTSQRPGFQLTYVSKTVVLPKHLHMIRPLEEVEDQQSKMQMNGASDGRGHYML